MEKLSDDSSSNLAKEQRLATREMLRRSGRKIWSIFHRQKPENDQHFFKTASEVEDELIEAEEKREKELKERERTERRRAEERASLERDFVNEMDQYRTEKFGTKKNEEGIFHPFDGEYQRQRIQETSERAFNEALTPLEDIEAYAESGDERISTREVEYDGRTIKVYDLKGFPIKLLTHAIDFKGYGDEKRIGSEMAGCLQKDPSLWMRPRNENNINSYDGDSDCISTSYIDSDINMFRGGNTGGKYFTLKYGFDHVLPDSILQIKNSDGATTRNIGGVNGSFLKRTDHFLPDDLAESSDISYNEVQIRRFDETGKPRKPDYIILNDGKGMETMLKHAAYFNIPILNIETREYEKQEVKNLVSDAERVMRNENAKYEDIAKVWQKIQSSKAIEGNKDTESTGYGRELSVLTIGGTPANETIKEFLQFELNKRVEEIVARFKATTDRMRRANEEGTPLWQLESGIVVERYSHGTSYVDYMPEKIEVRIKSIPDTIFYDGESFDGGKGYETSGGDIITSSSESYNAVLPAVEEYLNTLVELDPSDYWAKKEINRRNALEQQSHSL
ncbi:hypothetical protein IJH23_02985 [Candidatus Saccharibacteria bacterium]|nr:hypothetical protein [Candidatus Saccharibacteria bacterium]